MSLLPLSLASGLSCSTTVILINLAEKNGESEIKGREKCKRQSRESKGFCLSNDKINHDFFAWKIWLEGYIVLISLHTAFEGDLELEYIWFSS